MHVLHCVPGIPSRGKLHSPTGETCLMLYCFSSFPASLLYPPYLVSWDLFPSKLIPESLPQGVLLGEPTPSHCPAPLGLQQTLSNSSLRGCTPKGQGPSHHHQGRHSPLDRQVLHLPVLVLQKPEKHLYHLAFAVLIQLDGVLLQL